MRQLCVSWEKIIVSIDKHRIKSTAVGSFKIFVVTYFIKHKRMSKKEGQLGAELAKLSNQARFIMEKCDYSLTIENKRKKVMLCIPFFLLFVGRFHVKINV